jgi:hypothetical protein
MKARLDRGIGRAAQRTLAFDYGRFLGRWSVFGRVGQFLDRAAKA